VSRADLLIPDIGNFSDVAVVDVLVKPGDVVDIDSPLVTLETDKASMDVPATAAGTVTEVLLKRGDKVSKGSLIARLEAAAPAARKIFIDAITAMTFDDAHKILSGGDTAATDYFKLKTTPQLTAAFRPVVERTMDSNGVTQQYNALVAQYKSLPFAKNQDLDISHYVVSKALDGLFFELGQEESKIRKDPAAQTTSLLREVFGK